MSLGSTEDQVREIVSKKIEKMYSRNERKLISIYQYHINVIE